MSIPPVTFWGNPSSSKRVLCLHGLTSASQCWNRVAEALVNQGYAVTAPDLLGHGFAARSTDYTIAAFTQSVKLLVESSPPFDIVIGHSLGGVIALALIPYLPASVHVISVDPPLEMEQREVERTRDDCLQELRNVPSVEAYLRNNPRWTRKDAIAKVTGAHLCDRGAVIGLIAQNKPWTFTSLVPPLSPGLKVTIMGADPSLGPTFTPTEAEALARTHPHIATLTVTGAAHSIHRDSPEAIVEVALR